MANDKSPRIRIGILGSGNIGTDLLYKVKRNALFDLRIVAGIDPDSDGLARARELGIAASARGVDALLDEGSVQLVFDATSARAHLANAPRLKDAGIRAIDLTPAKVGPSVVPCVNMDERYQEANVNLISCAAQATIPLIYGFSRAAPVRYAEIVSTLASKGAGPGSRQNIEEFTHTTTRALVELGRAATAKAMIVFNPAEPPINMRNSVYIVFEDGVDEEALKSSVSEMVDRVRAYVPGYEVTVPPFRRGDHYMMSVEVKGAGDYLPKYAGNLDIINAAAIAVAERYAPSLLN